MHCSKCQELFLPGQRVQAIPKTQIIGLGVKSGMMGLYDDPESVNDDVLVVHYPRCCIGMFDPEENEHLYDEIVKRIETEIYDDVAVEAREEFRERLEQVQNMVERARLNFCAECLEHLEPTNEWEAYQERMARDR